MWTFKRAAGAPSLRIEYILHFGSQIHAAKINPPRNDPLKTRQPRLLPGPASKEKAKEACSRRNSYAPVGLHGGLVTRSTLRGWACSSLSFIASPWPLPCPCFAWTCPRFVHPRHIFGCNLDLRFVDVCYSSLDAVRSSPSLELVFGFGSLDKSIVGIGAGTRWLARYFLSGPEFLETLFLSPISPTENTKPAVTTETTTSTTTTTSPEPL